MPTYLGQRYPIEWEGRPPHMLLQDLPVWARWLKLYGGLLKTIYYDCFLGGPYLTPEQQKDRMMIMWAANTSKRADAIAETDDEVWIIEVSDYPGMRAIGQMFTYQALWLEDPKINKLERLVMVCSRLDSDIGAAAGKMGIQCYVVPPEAA